MKKFFLLLFFCFPLLASAQKYPWDLTGFGGAATLCVESGCFGPTGYTIGGSFGRQFADRWFFELEGAYSRTEEILPGRFDLFTGQFYIPEQVRQRTWGGLAFLWGFVRFGEASNMFLSMGAVLAYEHRYDIVPEGVFAPDRNIGLNGGVSGGAGMNLWFTGHWGFRPEIKYYAVTKNLSGVRYTGGLIYRFR